MSMTKFIHIFSGSSFFVNKMQTLELFARVSVHFSLNFELLKWLLYFFEVFLVNLIEFMFYVVFFFLLLKLSSSSSIQMSLCHHKLFSKMFN